VDGFRAGGQAPPEGSATERDQDKNTMGKRGPTLINTVMSAAEISATISPYSMAVARHPSRRSFEMSCMSPYKDP
jgi:hypothetical protein